MKSSTVVFVLSILLFSVCRANSVKLSFIMPCYNRASVIRESIDSIYRQKLNCTFEVVCTDDGSTDETLQVLYEYEKKYTNFRVCKHEINKGASEARNTCVKHARGEWIFNLDSDNVLADDSIQPLLDCMIASGTQSAAFSHVRHFRGSPCLPDLVYLEEYCHTKFRFNIHHLFKCSKSPGASGNYLYTKESFYRAGGYEGEGQETWVFCFKQLATGTTFAILPHSYYWHRISPDSYWWVLEKKGLNDKNCLAIVKQFSRLFTPQTVRFLRDYTPTKKFFVDLNAGAFCIRPLSTLRAEKIFDYYANKCNLQNRP